MALKQARMSKMLSQNDLADKIGCKEREICLLETGRSSPTYGMACRIAEVLGEPREKLFPEFK